LPFAIDVKGPPPRKKRKRKRKI